MAFKEFGNFDAVGLAERWSASKEVTRSASCSTRRSPARRKVDPEINAVVVKHYDYAEQQIGKGCRTGRSRAVPFLLKDLDLLRERAPPQAPAC